MPLSLLCAHYNFSKWEEEWKVVKERKENLESRRGEGGDGVMMSWRTGGKDWWKDWVRSRHCIFFCRLSSGSLRNSSHVSSLSLTRTHTDFFPVKQLWLALNSFQCPRSKEHTSNKKKMIVLFAYTSYGDAHKHTTTWIHSWGKSPKGRCLNCISAELCAFIWLSRKMNTWIVLKFLKE